MCEVAPVDRAAGPRGAGSGEAAAANLRLLPSSPAPVADGPAPIDLVANLSPAEVCQRLLRADRLSGVGQRALAFYLHEKLLVIEGVAPHHLVIRNALGEPLEKNQEERTWQLTSRADAAGSKAGEGAAAPYADRGVGPNGVASPAAATTDPPAPDARSAGAAGSSPGEGATAPYADRGVSANGVALPAAPAADQAAAGARPAGAPCAPEGARPRDADQLDSDRAVRA